MKKVWIIMVLVFPMITGCWDKVELEEQGFASIIGVDQSKQGQHRYTFSIINPLANTSPSGGGGGSNKPPSKVITVQANGLVPAINVANAMTSKDVNVSHAHILLISDKLAKHEDLRPLLVEMTRFRQFREDIMVFIVDGSAQRYMQVFKPVMEVYGYKYFDLNIRSAERMSAQIPVINLKEVLTRMSSIAEEAVIPTTSIKPTPFPHANTQKQGRISSETNHEAKNLPRQSTANEVFIGAAVFRKGQMVGEITGQEARIYRLLRGHWKQFSFSMPDPRKPGIPITATFRKKKDPEIKVLSVYPPKVEIMVTVTAVIDGIPSGINYVTDVSLRRELEKSTQIYTTKLMNDFIKKTQSKYDSDAMGIGERMRRRFWTWQSWQDYDWPTKYQKADIRAKIDVDFQFSGFSLRPYENVSQNNSQSQGGAKK